MKANNLFDYIPVKNQRYNWRENDKGLITIIHQRDGIFDKIMQRVFNTPKEVKIDLDHIGSEVWRNIDGEKTINDIKVNLKERFNERIDSVNERLIKYIKILNNSDFIKFKK
ncbi:MAG: PqqD family protein [Firmicutes bacterium]|nr:PqqD family protein [Bacillota bacterium]